MSLLSGSPCQPDTKPDRQLVLAGCFITGLAQCGLWQVIVFQVHAILECVELTGKDSVLARRHNEKSLEAGAVRAVDPLLGWVQCICHAILQVGVTERSASLLPRTERVQQERLFRS